MTVEWNTALIIVAAICGIVAFKFVAMRFGHRYIGIGPLCAALAAALVIFVIARNNARTVLDAAWGDNQWIQDGFVRLGIAVSLAVVVGYWVWYFYRSRYLKKHTTPE